MDRARELSQAVLDASKLTYFPSWSDLLSDARVSALAHTVSICHMFFHVYTVKASLKTVLWMRSASVLDSI